MASISSLGSRVRSGFKLQSLIACTAAAKSDANPHFKSAIARYTAKLSAYGTLKSALDDFPDRQYCIV